MGYIICQPDNSKESVQATKLLVNKQECIFDMTMEGARLQPLAFGSKACTNTEMHFHSFVGEVACGRWAIAQNKHYLWGTNFYWLCDCNSVKEILNYSGSIHMLSRWSMELLGYSFSIVHRPAKMMADVDCLARRYTTAFQRYVHIAFILHQNDMTTRPLAYDNEYFKEKPIRIRAPQPQNKNTDIPLFHDLSIQSSVAELQKSFRSNTTNISPHCNVSSILLHTLPPPPIINASPTTASAPKNLSQTSITDCIEWNYVYWLCVDDPILAFLQASNQITNFTWHITNVYTCQETVRLAEATQQHNQLVSNIIISTLHSFVTNTQFEGIINSLYGCDITYIPSIHSECIPWVTSTLSALLMLVKHNLSLCCIRLWIPVTRTTSQSVPAISNNIDFIMPIQWDCNVVTINTSNLGSAISTQSYCFILSPQTPNNAGFTSMPTSSTLCIDEHTFEPYIDKFYNILNKHHSDCYTIPPHTVTQPPTTHHISQSPRQLITITNNNTIIAHIMDPAHPIHPPYNHNHTTTDQSAYGIPYWNHQVNEWQCRQIHKHEYLSAYSNNQQHHTISQSLHQMPTITFNLVISACIPVPIHINILHHWIHKGQFDDIIFNESTQIDSLQCFTMQSKPNISEWSIAYAKDHDTCSIIKLLQAKNLHINKSALKGIHQAYHPHLMDNNIKWADDRLVLLKPLPLQQKAIRLIIVPQSMRKILFDHYHGGPTGGHMGEFKTLHRLRVRFFWPKMRKDVATWVRQCGQCIASKAWKNRKNDLYFSWPVTVPFWILHCDLWSPGATRDKDGNFSVLNCMCDLTQFVVSSVVNDISSEALSLTFMENVVLKYGICAVVAVDAGSNFKHIFERMCDILDITYWPLARGNHHGLSVERYHRYLNKTQTIQGANVGTHDNFKRNVLVSAYGWNSAPIDGTNIVRSIPAVGREFRFPLDTKNLPLPPLNDLNNSVLLPYLQEIGTESETATSILQLLIEDRRHQHKQRHNASKSPSNLQVGDVVTAHVQVQSNSKTGDVKKLSYRSRGPFLIVKDKGFGTFEVQPYNNPSAPTRLYKGIDL